MAADGQTRSNSLIRSSEELKIIEHGVVMISFQFDVLTQSRIKLDDIE